MNFVYLDEIAREAWNGDYRRTGVDIRVASRLAREALRRFEGVADNLTA